MSSRTRPMTICLAAVAACAIAMLAGCDPAPHADDAPDQAPAGSTAGEAPTESSPAPSDLPPPDETPAAPAQPAPDAPAPVEPSPVAKPTSAANQPPLESMTSARATGKIGVPVDLKYSFESPPTAGQPATLHLAAIPRISGSNLTVGFKTVEGVRVTSEAALGSRKADASSAYRQHYSVTRQGSEPLELRVLVTMETAEGSAFGFFGIPLERGILSQEPHSVKRP